jgi:phage terminase small subunit
MSRYTDDFKADAIAQMVADGYPDNEFAPNNVRQILIESYGRAPMAKTLKRWFDEHNIVKDNNLTKKQEVFLNEYLSCWNATEAARRAGYSENSLRSIASENLTKPDIQQAIQDRLEEMKMSADEALVGLSKIARGNIADFVDVEEGDSLPLPNFGKAQDKLDIIKKMSWNKGSFSFELYDKKSALDTIAKHHGLLKEHIQIDIKLVIEVIDALNELGQDPTKVFQEIIQRANARRAN